MNGMQSQKKELQTREKDMILLISGPRKLEVEPELIGELLKENNLVPDKIITGGARGIDACAKEYARSANIEYEALLPIHQARWGAIANNRRLAESADILLAITDGESKGTADMITRMQNAGKPTFVYVFKNDG